MRNILLALALTLPLARPASAAETIIGNKDLNLILGYKLWINSWNTWNNGKAGSPHFSQVGTGGVGNNLNGTFRYKWFFTNMGYMFTGNYNFPQFTENDGTKVSLKANRQELDWNVGGMVVPQLGFTVGIKTVHQRWINAFTGATNVNYNYAGPTFGIVGNAAIGKGFSLYGNGAGGIMSLRQTDAANTTLENDSGSYESAEMGIGWKAPSAPVSASFGYKFQKLSTKLNQTGYENLRGIDLTTGYIMSLNLIF